VADFANKHAKCRLILLEEFARLLEKHSWSEKMISQAESNCALDHGYHHVIFSGGMQDILVEFERWQDSLMLEEIEITGKPSKIREQIAKALEIRIMKLLPKAAAINHYATFALPQNLLIANQSAMETCDVIWKSAGDRSSDFNYYTKRGLVFPVYLASRAVYFADNSENYQDSQEFIKNALDNIVNLASFKHRIQLPRLEDIPILRFFL
jgi:ubiquinone biosynthesis protein COQ9